MQNFSFLVLFFLSFLLTNNMQAQVIQDDFEGGGNITNWFGDDCEIDTDFANPYMQNGNSSAKVLRYNDIGGQYANVRFEMSDNFVLSENNTFSLKIYVPVSSITGNSPQQVSLKLQDGNLELPWTTQSEIIKPVTLNQWQTITFDFENDNFSNFDGNSLPPIMRTDFNRVVIQVNGENNEDFVTAYIDDIIHFNTVFEAPVFDNLVWADEFENDGEIDLDNWFQQSQIPEGGSWYNGEIQHYTNRVENSFVENGALNVKAIKENFTDQGVTKQYTSARLNSKFAFQYGRVEVRAKLPTGVGTWPAIWMLGKNINEDGAYWDNQGFDTSSWPACGEIDIMEHWGDNQNYVQSATHTPSSFGATVNHGGQLIPTASTDFHVYALEWTAQRLVFSVDGEVHFIYNPEVKNPQTWPFDAEQYILLNIAIQPQIFAGFTEDAMEIDYVRIYQESSTATEEIARTQPTFFPNPIANELTINIGETSAQNLAVSIFDTQGKRLNMQTSAIDNGSAVLRDLGSLARGMYFVSYELEKRIYSFKVFKD